MKSRLESTTENYKIIKKYLEEIERQLSLINHDVKVMHLFARGNMSMYEELKMYIKVKKKVRDLNRLLKHIK